MTTSVIGVVFAYPEDAVIASMCRIAGARGLIATIPERGGMLSRYWQNKQKY